MRFVTVAGMPTTSKQSSSDCSVRPQKVPGSAETAGGGVLALHATVSESQSYRTPARSSTNCTERDPLADVPDRSNFPSNVTYTQPRAHGQQKCDRSRPWRKASEPRTSGRPGWLAPLCLHCERGCGDRPRGGGLRAADHKAQRHALVRRSAIGSERHRWRRWGMALKPLHDLAVLRHTNLSVGPCGVSPRTADHAVGSRATDENVVSAKTEEPVAACLPVELVRPRRPAQNVVLQPPDDRRRWYGTGNGK